MGHARGFLARVENGGSYLTDEDIVNFVEAIFPGVPALEIEKRALVEYLKELRQADKVFRLDKEIEGDVFFPDYSQFKKTSESEWQNHEDIRYKFFELEK